MTKRQLEPVMTVGGQIVRVDDLFKKAMNFAKAAAQHVAAGSPQATDEQVKERFAICNTCELYAPKDESQGTCRHPSCGCSLKQVGITGRNKLRWADQQCPLNKWLAIPPAGEST